MKTKLNLLKSAGFLATFSICFGQPIITSQPGTQAAAPGAAATFRVGVTGIQPLAYQWQKNPGNGFPDLADRANAALVLTNLQPWDAGDYRVVVTNSTGARTSAVASLYVMRTALVTTREVIDNFDDGKLTGWTSWSSNGQGRLIESNGQFTVHGYWPGVITTSPYDSWAKGWKTTSTWAIADGQTLEWRVGLISMSESPSIVKPDVAVNQGLGYSIAVGHNFVGIAKWLPGFAVLCCEKATIRSTNVILALAMTRVQTNLVLTARVLEPGEQGAVLFQRSVVDTPGVDPTLTTAEFNTLTGMRFPWDTDVVGMPLFSGNYVDLEIFQFNNGTKPAAEVTFDNLELWKSTLPVTHYVNVNSTNARPPFKNWFTAATNIQDAVDAAQAGDEIVVTNGIYATDGRAVGTNVLVNRVAVDKPLTVRSVNGPEMTIIQGYQVPGTTNGDGAIRCVYLANGASLSGFTLTKGATRVVSGWPYTELSGGGVCCESTNAVVLNCVVTGNSASFGGGTYGGTLYDCTLNGNAAENGGGAAGTWDQSCVLNNCTLTGNSGASGGGGVYWGSLNGCTLAGNSAGWDGGGACSATLNNCALTGNSAGWYGGGVAYGTMNNCTLTGNSAETGGGAAGSWDMPPCTLNNCIVYFNSASEGPNYSFDTVLNYCSTTPMPASGGGNITNAPLFVDLAGDNLCLQSNSPCINAGLNAYAPGPTDLDGLPRIVSGMVDIGAYEFQGPGSVISYAWLQQYGLPTDGSADFADPDRDGMNNWQEWRCLTDPTNALSVLRLLSAAPNSTNVTVTWQSVAGVSYSLERSTNLSASPPFTLLAPELSGQPGTTTFTDANAANLAPLFYRVGVTSP